MSHFTFFLSYTDSHSLCHYITPTFAVLHAGAQTLSFPPASCHSVSCSPPAPSFGSWPVSLVLGNTYLLYPQLPTKPHTQQHIAGDRETFCPPVCWCVGGYMITFKYVCLCVAYTGVWVCLQAHLGVCGEADAIRSDMCGEIMALSGEQCEHTQSC